MTEEEFQELLATHPVPKWLQEMQEHYRKTGSVRLLDLRRLLGDISRSVDADPRGILAKHFLTR